MYLNTRSQRFNAMIAANVAAVIAYGEYASIAASDDPAVTGAEVLAARDAYLSAHAAYEAAKESIK